MLTLPPSTRVFVATRPADMRRSFDGLLALVREFLGEQDDPFAGHLFVFRNKSGDRIKILWWDRDGLALFYKKHQADYTHSGSFTEPRPPRHRTRPLDDVRLGRRRCELAPADLPRDAE